MSNDIAYFAVKSIGLSQLRGRKPCCLRDAARHNLREIQSELGANGSIDATKTIKNWVIAGSTTSDGVLLTMQEMAAAAGVDLSQKRRDYCQAIELLFSLPEKSEIEVSQYFQKCLQWAEGAYALPVLSAVAHLDESSPHCHILLLPLDRDGKYLGCKPIEKPETKRHKESFFTQVAGPAGLKRQGGKLVGQVKQAALAIIFKRCTFEGLPSANGALWPFFEAAIRKDPVRVLEALGIDKNAVNSEYKARIAEQFNPIGIDSTDQKMQTLSSVGVAHPSTIGNAGHLRKQEGTSRLAGASQVKQAAEKRLTQCSRQKRREFVLNELPTDVLTRVKDEYVHDLSPWDE
jgi:hypothetical protein